ncbi:MAG: hypothetical protein WBE52_06570 [Terriglobales bacterium]
MINFRTLRNVCSIGFFTFVVLPVSLPAQTTPKGICGKGVVTPCIEQPTATAAEVKGQAWQPGANLTIKVTNQDDGTTIQLAGAVIANGTFSIKLAQPLKEYDLIEINQPAPAVAIGPIAARAQPDQTCAKGKPPCIDQPHEGDTQITGKVPVNAKAEIPIVKINVGTTPTGPAQVNLDGIFSKSVNKLSQYDKIEADETTGAVQVAIGPVSVQTAAPSDSDATSSLYTLGLAGFNVTGTSASGPKQQYYAQFNVISPLHWLGRACWSPATEPIPDPKNPDKFEIDQKTNRFKTQPRSDGARNDQIYPLAGRCWVWVDPRISSVPTTTSTALNSITTASIAGSGSQSVSTMTQSVEFQGGGEFYIAPPYKGALFGSGSSWAKTTVSMIWGGGFTTPFNATTGSPEYGLSGNLAQQFNQDSALPSLYPQLATALCSYGFTGAQCPNPLPVTKPTVVAFVFPNRTRFYRDFFGGIRLRTFYYKGTCSKRSNADTEAVQGTSNTADTNQACTPTNSFPGTFDVRFGEDESVTAGHLSPLVMTLTGSYPLPGTAGAVRIFGASYMRLRRNQNSTALVLIPTATFTTLDTPTLVVQPIQPSDQDYYRLGVGVDLVALVHKFWSAQQPKTQPPATTGGATAPATQ